MMETKNEKEVKTYRDAPAAYTSNVWKFFGFALTDQKKAVCKICHTEVKYSGGTTNLAIHMKRHHQIDVNAVPKGISQQSTGPTSTGPAASSAPQKPTTGSQGPFQYCASKAKLPQNQMNRITMSIAKYLVTDMRPFVTVQNKAFREMIHTCEPKYKFPSRDTFSETMVPKLYETTAQRLKTDLRASKSVAWTTDAWTSRATESYVTITAHYIKDFKLHSNVLQTRKMDESHTGSNIALILTQAAMEWGHFPMSLTTDNAANMTVAAREAHISIHIGCIAHTINLASMKAVDCKSVHNLLARIRPIVGYFHRSVQASHILEEKQDMLKLPKHKLIIDVKTRWNSAYLMVERFLEQQVAVLATLTDEKVKKDVSKSSFIQNLSNDDITAAETFLRLMEAMYHATLVFSDNKPTVGMILPMLDKLKANFSPDDEDSTIASQIKKSVLDNLNQRYRDAELIQFLEEATAFDPRVKHTTSEPTWQRLQEKGSKEETFACSVVVKQEPGTTTTETVPLLPNLPELPSLDRSDPEMKNPSESAPPQPLKKKAALSFFFNDEEVEITKVEPGLPIEERFRLETLAYRAEKRRLSSLNPLDFWNEKQTEYPLLSGLAMKYLCVQASSVPSERIFSTAGDIVTATRSCLDPESVDQLIFLKKNLSDEDQIRVLERM